MNDDDDSEFGEMIPGVKRMRNDRINVYRHRARKRFTGPAPRQPQDQLETGMLAQTARESYFHTGLQKKLQRRIRQGVIRPEDSLDLHGYRQAEALEALESFINDATRADLRMVIIIHGQGYRSQTDAVLKPLVQRWLANQPLVLAWCPAQPRDGAAGASYVYLRSGRV